MILRGTLLLLSGLGAVTLDAFDGVQMMQRVNAAEEERESEVAKVISTRRYVLRNKRWDKDAVMRARIVSQPGAPKRFEILALENAEGLQKKVFEKILEGEVEASRARSHEAESRVSPDNYEFVPLGTETMDGKACAVLQLKPKRKSKYLIEGKAWVDAKEHAIVRIEGKTARSVSFWIGSPSISQSFTKVDGVWVSKLNRSTSHVKFLGATELTVDFTEYDIVRRGRQVARHAAATPGS